MQAHRAANACLGSGQRKLTRVTLAEWLDRLEQLDPSRIDLTLDRVSRVLSRLPSRPAGLRQVTIGGTNGKGSTVAFLEALLPHFGFRVASYTSPYLFSYNERIRFNGAPIEDAKLVECFEAVERARAGELLTYFEFGTLAAIYAIFQDSPDIALFEVGMGGRLDAVNALDPDIAAITSIDLDHQAWLGDTREAIGGEKAHIFRPGKPAICGDPAPPATIQAHAETLGAELIQRGEDFGCTGLTEEGGWEWYGKTIRGQHVRLENLPPPALHRDNLATALQIASSLGLDLARAADRVESAVASTRLAGRCAWIHQRPNILVDVAHNPHAVANLAKVLEQKRGSGRTLGIFSALQDKDVRAMAGLLKPVIHRWWLAELHGEARRMPLDQLEQGLRSVGIEGITRAASIADGVGEALSEATPEDTIVIFGSFYTVNEAILALRRHEISLTGHQEER